MAHHEGTSESARNATDRVWPQVRGGPLMVATTPGWTRELQTPPAVSPCSGRNRPGMLKGASSG
jgi:hypothetical protein